MAITAQDIIRDFNGFQSRMPVVNVSVSIGDTTDVTGSRGTEVRANNLEPEGLTPGADFPVYVQASKFSSETLTPLRTLVTVDEVEYVLVRDVPLPSQVILRLDLQNRGRG